MSLVVLLLWVTFGLKYGFHPLNLVTKTGLAEDPDTLAVYGAVRL